MKCLHNVCGQFTGRLLGCSYCHSSCSASFVYHYSAAYDSFEKTAEEPICASCSERIETVHYRHHSGNGYLYDPSAQCRKFWCIISRYNGSYYDDCSWNRILRFKKSPEEWYFTDWTDWNIGFSRTNCVWIIRGGYGKSNT